MRLDEVSLPFLKRSLTRYEVEGLKCQMTRPANDSKKDASFSEDHWQSNMRTLCTQAKQIALPQKSSYHIHTKKDFSFLCVLKFIYSEKATKFCEISTLLLSYVVPVKIKVEISQNFVAFSEYMHFKTYKVDGQWCCFWSMLSWNYAFLSQYTNNLLVYCVSCPLKYALLVKSEYPIKHLNLEWTGPFICCCHIVWEDFQALINNCI